MEFFSVQDGGLVFESDGEMVRVEAWGDHSLRVRAQMMGLPQDTDYALLPAPEGPGAEIVIHHETQTATVTHGKITAEIRHDPWDTPGRITFRNQDGKVLLREQASGGALKLRARAFRPLAGGDHSLAVTFEARDDERFYGMGQYQQETFNLKGASLELAHRNSQASVPFVYSSRGYGFLWHNPAIGQASFASNQTCWRAESTRGMDYWITAGDTPAEIATAYGHATGMVPEMPEYGLGFWQCKLRYYSQEQVLSVAREYRRRNLPVDVIVVDFFHWPRQGDFRFEEEFFPDPAAMVRELEAMNIRLMVSVWPQIDHKSENYEEMKQKGYLIRAERGVPVAMMQWFPASIYFDATNPKARRYVWEKCRKNYYSHGIRIFWLDEAEPEYDVYDFDNYRYALGPNLQIGNIYPQHYSRTFYEGMQAEGQTQIVNLVRCAWAGSQRYGALVWSGDIHSSFEDFRRQLVAGLHMGVAGIPWWTTDIGGFSGGNPGDPAFRELLVRWFQWGAFCPVMRLHGDRSTARPEDREVYRRDGSAALFTGGNNEVWSFGEAAYPILVKYMRLRERMRAYVRECMTEAHRKGYPVMRTMFFEFPGDNHVWDLKDQYMFGPDMLVAPVMHGGAESRQVYLPEGAEWTEAWSGKVFTGGQTLCADAPLDQIPVFLRNGRHRELFREA